MIELPDFAAMGNAVPSFLDAGFTQRGIGSLSRIDRKGSRYRLSCSYGPFPFSQDGNRIVSALIAGKSEGIRVPLPLQVAQGAPGSPVVDGAGQTGKTFNLRDLTPGYHCKDGYWLSFYDGTRHYLHNVKTGGRADSAGDLTITLNELPRAAFADGAAVFLAKPMVEGFVEGEAWEWQLSVDRVVPIRFSIEEAR